MRLPFFNLKDPVATGDVSARGRKAAASTAAAALNEPGALEAARVRARRRLIGAVVLLGVGILGFPLLFETKPRPLPIDTPIDASRVDLTNPRVASGAVAPQRPLPVLPADAGNEGPVAAVAAVAAVALAPPAAGPAPALAPAALPAAVPAVKPPAVAPSAAAAPKPSAAKTPVVAAPSAPPVVAPAVPAKAATSAPAATVAPALPLPAAEAAAAGSTVPRYVVQVGAFNDNTRMREARMKVERIGYATYISEVDSPTGRRTRVRLGPFTNKDEADAAAIKVKAAGLPANILKL